MHMGMATARPNAGASIPTDRNVLRSDGSSSDRVERTMAMIATPPARARVVMVLVP